MNDKIVSIHGKGFLPNNDDEAIANKENLLKTLEVAKGEIESGRVITVAVVFTYNEGTSGNMYNIPGNTSGNALTVVGALECLKQRIIQNELDVA